MPNREVYKMILYTNLDFVEMSKDDKEIIRRHVEKIADSVEYSARVEFPTESMLSHSFEIKHDVWYHETNIDITIKETAIKTAVMAYLLARWEK